MSYDNASVESLLTELHSNTEACALIRSFTCETEAAADASHGDTPQQEFVDWPPSVSDVVETTRTLLEECQVRECLSADATLALRGTNDLGPVLQQVHR